MDYDRDSVGLYAQYLTCVVYYFAGRGTNSLVLLGDGVGDSGKYSSGLNSLGDLHEYYLEDFQKTDWGYCPSPRSHQS